MSLPHSIAGLSNKRKHSTEEHGGRRVGSSGTNFDGPPPAPVHRGHVQGQESDNFGSGRHPNYVATDEAQQTRNSTASAEAKSTLRRVMESQNAYPPLKSVAKYLCFILDNSKVWPSSHILDPQRLLPL